MSIYVLIAFLAGVVVGDANYNNQAEPELTYTLVLYEFKSLKEFRLVEESMHSLTDTKCKEINKDPKFSDFEQDGNRYTYLCVPGNRAKE